MTLPVGTARETAAAERRPVTVLFADVVNSTSLAERMDPEDWSGAIRSVLDLVAAAVERYGGSVAQRLGDGLLAIFGAPAAHEDDAVRAVQAALEMIDSVAVASPALRREYGKELGESVQIRVGINTGLAIVEGMGDGAGDLDALGDTVNVAARMQAAARPGTVLVTGETWRYAGPVFQGTSLGGVQVKGRLEPVVAWEVLGRNDQPGTGRGLAGLSSAMVGRDEELNGLRSLLSAIRAGRGRAAVLLGEPGVGKSRLLAELRGLASTVAAPQGSAAPTGSAATQGSGTSHGSAAPTGSASADGARKEVRVTPVVTEARWIEARCISYGENVPYGVVAELVAASLGVSAALDPHDRLAALQARCSALFGPAWEEPFASLAHLLNLPLPADVAALMAPLSPQALRARYVAASETILRTICSAGPTVVVIEDVHWADASSVEVLGKLLPLAHEVPVLLILTSRPERAALGWHLIETARETFGDALAEFPLSPLDAAGSRLLVSNLLEIESLPERLRTSILERSEGNPFFVEELIRMLIERGWVVRSGDHWIGSGTIAEAEVPDTLRGLLLARVDRLPGEARRTLRMASVIGRDVPVRLLETITGDASATGRALGQAEAAGLVRFAAADPEPVYRFRHALLQEAAYDSLLKQDRRRLHRQVGEALEAQHGGERREELAPILGLHFERAGDTDKAVEYLQMAGRQALRRRAVTEARDLLDRAAAALDDAPEDPEHDRLRVEVAIDRAAAGVSAVKLEDDLELLARARLLAETLGDERLIARVRARDLGTRALRGWILGPSEQRQAIGEVMAIGQRLNDPEILPLPRALYAMLLVGEGRRREAIPILEESVKLLEQFVVNEASFYAMELAHAHAELGEFDNANRAVQRGRALAERSGDPRALADADIFEASILGLQGRHQEAIELALRGGRQAESIGELMCQTMAKWTVGENELALQRTVPAIQWLEEATDMARVCQAESVERMATVTLLTARALAADDPSSAVGLDRLLDLTREAGNPLHEAIVLMRRAQASATGPGEDHAAAVADSAAAIDILRRIDAPPFLAMAEQLHSMVA